LAEDRPQVDEYLAAMGGVAGLSVRVDEALQVATLRYFAPDGELAEAVHEVTGLALPQPQQALTASDGQLILAWRSPTETLCLAGNPARLAQLAARLAGLADGCFVNLSGGLKIARVSGTRVSELLCRLGGTGSIPRPGEARRSRMADVPVVAVSLTAGETLLVVDRAYAEHLMGWIRETLLDFADA
jgi:heterotetrameric sarcosine oxidase gamma subunit